MNPVQQLEKLGQSIWLDYIRRDMLENGDLAKLINEVGVTGMTSNPSIFEKAIAGSDDYNEAFITLVKDGKSADEIYEALVISDIQAAADLLRPVYDRTQQRDGFVSLEVSPELANDTEGTISDARRLWKAVDRPNLLIKIPATEAGIPAVETCLSEGINVNVTLMFSMKHYEDVAEAYISGLEKRDAAGGSIDKIGSVASFFLSRVDTEVDNALGDGSDLAGKAAVSNAKVVYARFCELFSGARWEALAAKGAGVQQVLWASTSTKNPSYPDLLYVETIVGKDTVNTLPPKTLDALLDHGTAALTVSDDVDGSRKALTDIVAAGVDLDKILQDLQDAGVASFTKSFTNLMGVVRDRREQLLKDQPWAKSASA